MNLSIFFVVLAFVVMITSAMFITGSALPLVAIVLLRDMIGFMCQLDAMRAEEEPESEPGNMGFLKDQ